MQNKSNSHVDSSRAAVVDNDYYWKRIDKDTLRGCKLQLINREAGVASYGVLKVNDEFWTHWAPLPRFKD